MCLNKTLFCNYTSVAKQLLLAVLLLQCGLSGIPLINVAVIFCSGSLGRTQGLILQRSQRFRSLVQQERTKVCFFSLTWSLEEMQVLLAADAEHLAVVTSVWSHLLQPSNRVVPDGWSFPSEAALLRPVIGKTPFWNNIICCQPPRS